MIGFTPRGPSVALVNLLGAGAVAAASVASSHLLLSNMSTGWLLFFPLAVNTAPGAATGGVPVGPGGQIVIAGADNAGFWGSFGAAAGTLEVTPGAAF
jgi:hypothetical protein